MQPADIAVELRPRTPWEAIDLGLAMLQRWWRQAYAAHAVLLFALASVAVGIAWMVSHPWIALVAVWWLKPVYDRIVLHVLSRAVFGNVQGARAALNEAREWTGGLFWALTLGRFDLARSFNLPVVQLEGQRGSAARERRSLLGRRARGHAVWLTIVFLHFEAVLYWSFYFFASLLMPATAQETRDFFDALVTSEAWGYDDVATYAMAVLILEPFYVAGGFALYLNRRTLLEGWDLEVALRRIAARAAPVVLLLFIALPAFAQQKDPKQEIAEVLKDPIFGYERDAMGWRPRNPSEEKDGKVPDFRFAGWLAKFAQYVMWVLVAAAVIYALWWLVRNFRPQRAPPVERYQAPASLFGMELAPETLPPDVPGAVLALLARSKTREALALLYRASLSRLVHQRGVQLRASHTEMEVLALAPSDYLRELVGAWRACAYADRLPPPQAVERLAEGYKAGYSAL